MRPGGGGRRYVAVVEFRRPFLQILAAVSMAPALSAQASAQRDLAAQINETLAAARPALLAHLRDATREPGTRVGELALLTLAAAHDGVPEEQLRPTLERLARGETDETYDLALRLMVAEACPTLPGRTELIARDAKMLLANRCSDGPFQYRRQPSTWDLSNTQYGALGLRAAAAAGVRIEDRVWEQIAEEVGAQQDSYGGFGYSPGSANHKNSYASMTAAGIAVLAICRQALGDRSAIARRCQQQIERGWRWFDANKADIGSLSVRWSYYFHYGLERAAILCDVTKLNSGLDWYATGAKMLCDAQMPGGGWRSMTDGFPGHHLDKGRGTAVPTAFAILFLRRKFQKEAGPITPRVVTLASIGPRSSSADVEACAKALAARGKAAMPDLVKGLRSDVLGQRQAAAGALREIAGDAFGYEPVREPEEANNRAAVHRAELWFLKNR